MTQIPAGKDLSDTAATLATWRSKGGKWGAKLVRNYAGAYTLLETKDGRPCGSIGRPAGYFTRCISPDAEALEYFKAVVPGLFDVTMAMTEAQP